MIPSTPGWFTSSSPTTLPGPETKLKTPVGHAGRACRPRTSFSPVNTPMCAGLSTTVLPATSAADDGPAASAIGKLNGLMTAHTPYGRRTS